MVNAADEWLLVLEAIATPVLFVDPDGRLIRIKSAARALCSDDALETLEDLGGGEPCETTRRLVRATSRTRRSSSAQVRDEAGRSWHITVHLVERPEPETDETLVIMLDVTQVAALEESLRRSEQMAELGTLVAGVAHAVRNPLFGISATVDAFEAQFGPGPEHGKYFAALREELGHLSGLMSGLLEYGKPRAPRFSVQPVHEVLAEAVRSLLPLASQRGVRLDQSRSETLTSIPMDRDHVLDLFQNLLENAILHSPPAAVVEIEAHQVVRRGQAWIEASVLDSGTGFDAEDLPRVFELFFSRRPGGSGLGLSIAQRIAEEHGGRVAASNRPEGGARVVVRLPITNGQTSAPKRRPA